jgi:1-acyl-sn-glycerol-3-phosphate acyltransferase
LAPEYRLPRSKVFRLVASVLLGRKRSFRRDAREVVAGMKPPLQVFGHENIPEKGPCLLTFNHYFRPGFGVWWVALGISSLVPEEIHWVMTGAWTYPPGWRDRLVTPATKWAFTRLARTYQFTIMPPMPPRSHEVADRARSVREVLAYARQEPMPLVSLAPEGGDQPGGLLNMPPSGAGRFILHLADLGLKIAPVGAYEANGALCLRFGPSYRLSVSTGFSADERDREASRIVMSRIAQVLPVELRGAF